MSSPPFLFLNGHIPELSVQPERNTCQQKPQEVAEILVTTEEIDAYTIGSFDGRHEGVPSAAFVDGSQRRNLYLALPTAGRGPKNENV